MEKGAKDKLRVQNHVKLNVSTVYLGKLNQNATIGIGMLFSSALVALHRKVPQHHTYLLAERNGPLFMKYQCQTHKILTRLYIIVKGSFGGLLILRRTWKVTG